MEPMLVAVRVRPLVSNEINSGCRPCIEKIRGFPQIIVGNNQQFSFNYVFDDESGQLQIYESSVQPLISKLFEGYNVTILAYGQTGTGKTYTMGTNYSGSGEMGVIPRAIIDIFDKIKHSNEKCEVSVSFIELYNEVLYDLLTSRDREQSVLELRETGNSLVIPGLTKKEVLSAEAALEVLHEGSSLRVTGATNMNATSSRSHAVFTVNLKIIPNDDPNNSVLSKFHLVDLAGSERAKKTGTSGERFKEGVNINKGLLILGNVISQLGGGNASYINYRDSKLTRLLQDSLGGNSYTLMIACVSPADSNQEESLCTLRYADRVKKIKNKPVVNVDPQARLINQLKKEVETLRLQIVSPDAGSGCPSSHQFLEEKLKIEMKRNLELSTALKTALHQNPTIYERTLMIENVTEKTKERISELADLLEKAVSNPEVTSFKDLLETVKSIQQDFVQAENDIIHHSKSKHEEELRHKSESDDVGPPDDVQEQHVLFQAKTNKEIEALTKSLLIKQGLCEQLEKNSGQLANLNDSGQTIEYLSNLVKELEAEKQTLLQSKSKAVRSRFGAITHNSNTPESVQIRLHQLENDLQKAQKKLVEQEKLLKFKAKSEEKIVNLRKEIQSMKSLKVQLIHQMRSENERFRNWQNEKNREICKLKNINAKQNTQISKMEKEFTLRQAVLRRKLEAAAAAKKKMEQAVNRRNISSLKKDFEPDKLEEYILAEIDVHESISYAKKSLQNLMDDRASLMKEIQSVQDLINKGKSMKPSELESCKKKKKIMEQELELQCTQIADIQQKIMSSKQDERKHTRWEGIKSLVEAKHALCFLFTVVSKTKKESMSLNDITKDLKTELEDKIKDLEALQDQLHKAETKNKSDEIVREYEEICQILSQKNAEVLIKQEECKSSPLQNLTFSASNNSQLKSQKRKISDHPQNLNPHEKRSFTFEMEYLKFLSSRKCEEEETMDTDENTPPIKKSKSKEINDTTFNKLPSPRTSDSDSFGGNFRPKDGKFFED